MGYFKNLYSRRVQPPRSNVAVIDQNAVYQQPVQLYLERANNPYAKCNLKVKGLNGIKYYKGKCKKTKHVICTLDEKPIFTIENSRYHQYRKIIYLKKDNDNIIGKIKFRHSNVKYHIEFTNLFSGVKEYFEMNSDKKLVVCGIFYGREKEGAPLIAKITRDPRIRTKCTLEIAPGVDNIFMMGLAAFFSDRPCYGVGSRFVPKIRNIRYESESEDDDDDADDNGEDGIAYVDCGYDRYGDFDTNGDGGWVSGGYDGDGGWVSGGYDGDGGWDGGDGGDCGGDGGGGDCGGGDGGGGGD